MRIWVAVIAWVCLAAQAHATGSTEDYFKFFDANRDGRIVLAEYMRFADERFGKKDQNQVGATEHDEIHSGRIGSQTREALRDEMAAMFAKADKDEDGFLSLRELDEAE